MFSNGTDGEMLEVILLKVKNVLGSKLKTNVFMSDMAEEFFNFWQVVMKQPTFRLFFPGMLTEHGGKICVK